MHKTRMDEITIWFSNGTPARIVWRGKRFRVNDEPTRLDADRWWHPVITHPPEINGWRFQAQGESGETKVFDVRETPNGWLLLKTYE